MLDSSKVLILRSCHAGFKAHGGFQWPNQVGAVVTPARWDSSAECGNGLHGFLKGEGCGSLADWSETAEWLVIEADTASVVNLGGEKVKVPQCVIVYVGQGDSAVAKRIDCLAFMASKGQLGEAPIGRVALALGDRSTLTGGYGSTLTGGDDSTLTGGDGSTLTGGHGSTLTGGDGSTLTGGHGSTLTGGYGSTLTGGDRSTLTGGDRSTLTGGDGSTLTGGDHSTLTGGYRSTLTGGYGSTLLFKFWHDSKGRYLRKMFTIGDDDCVVAGVKYRMNEAGILEQV